MTQDSRNTGSRLRVVSNGQQSGNKSALTSIMLGVASAHGDKGKGKEDKDENEFASREPEFSLAIEANCEDVEKSVDRQ